MRILLIAGLWLDAGTWDAVAGELRALGHDPVPVELPGQRHGRDDASATLPDQVAAVVAAVDDARQKVLVVGHSAASSLAWLAADARPAAVAAVAFIGGFPAEDADPYADFFEIDGDVMPFPGWAPFEGPDSSDLDDAQKQRFEAEAVPVPAGVARGVVRLRDDRRLGVPATVICPEFSPDEAREWLAAGDLPELARISTLTLVNIDSGHWPMITRPRRLAGLLAEIADQAVGDG